MENKFTQAVHEELLELMKEIHDFLTNNGIKYSLAYGSLLGAVRHNGFIPWDDDIDLMMDRENLNKLLELTKDGEKNFVIERDLWIHRIRRRKETKASAYVPTMDIFVMDNVPDEKFARKSKIFKLKILQGMLKPSADVRKTYSCFYRVCMGITRLFGKFFTYNFKFNKYHKTMQKGNKKQTARVACFNASFRSLSVFFNSGLLDQLSLHDFAGEKFYIIDRYDEYLTAVYGDYMTPPKESERVPQHL